LNTTGSGRQQGEMRRKQEVNYTLINKMVDGRELEQEGIEKFINNKKYEND
jgi:hypothetical protein